MAGRRDGHGTGLARLVGVEVLLVAGGLGTGAAVRAALPADPLAEPAGAVAAAVGVVALALALYLATVVALGLAARVVGSAWLHRVAWCSGPPRLRGLAVVLVGTAVTVGTAGVAAGGVPAPSGSGSHAGRRAAAPVMTVVTGPTIGGHALGAPVPAPAQAPVMTWLAPDPDPVPRLETVPVPPPPVPTTWTIAAGDHLWSVAARTLAGARGRSPSDAETLAYVEVLVAANHDRFVVPGDADLVRPGQVFVLPPVPA